MALWHFMNAGSVVGIPWGSGGHSNKIICLNFLHSQVVGMQKLWAWVFVPAVPSLIPEPPGRISTTWFFFCWFWGVGQFINGLNPGYICYWGGKMREIKTNLIGSFWYAAPIAPYQGIHWSEAVYHKICKLDANLGIGWNMKHTNQLSKYKGYSGPLIPFSCVFFSAFRTAVFLKHYS